MFTFLVTHHHRYPKLNCEVGVPVPWPKISKQTNIKCTFLFTEKFILFKVTLLKLKKVEVLFFFKKISQLNVMFICSLNLFMCMYNNFEEYKLFKMI